MEFNCFLDLYSKQDSQWKDCPSLLELRQQHEDKAYSFLDQLIPKIIACKPDATKQFYFKCNPTKAPGCRRDNKTRPDCAMVLEDGDYHWDYIGVPGEFKLYLADAGDNTLKIIWSLHHILRSDPRRRFAYGITMEEFTVRVWHASRSAVVVSEAFDIHDDPPSFISLVFFLSCCDPTELGWDTTITRIGGVEARPPQYCILVNDTNYTTTKVLFDSPADALLGRGTRVWLAHPENDQNIKVVLKDCWIDGDRFCEGDIRDQISRDAQAADADRVAELFLTIREHGYVRLSDGQEDRTRDLKPTSSTFRLPTGDARPHSRSSTGVGIDRPNMARYLAKKPPSYRVKKHYRIVFNEVGTTLFEETDLAVVFRCLLDVIHALTIMHRGRVMRVHRDISIANILVINGRGRLADLEYVKDVDSGTGHDVRTGTLDYMPWDVYIGNLTFYNPAHDFESVMWCGLYKLCQLWPLTAIHDSNSSATALFTAAQALFPTLGAAEGRALFWESGAFEFDLLPSYSRYYGQILGQIRAHIFGTRSMFRDLASSNPTTKRSTAWYQLSSTLSDNLNQTFGQLPLDIPCPMRLIQGVVGELVDLAPEDHDTPAATAKLQRRVEWFNQLKRQPSPAGTPSKRQKTD